MAELLLELFSEEIPARMQARAGDDLKRLVTDKLKEAGLTFTEARAYTTPRRLALVVDGLPLAQPDVTEEKRGPRVGAPDQAIQGFLKSAGLTSLDQCEKRDTGKGEFWFAAVKKKGVKTSALLPGLLAESFAALPWPKSMRWAGHQYRWVRPLHSIVATFDGALLDGAVDLGGRAIQFGNVTRGHRFHDPREITVAAFADYKVKLREAYVIVDPAERRAAIKAQTEKLATAEGLTVKPDEALLDEVTGLVEWPVALMGRIDGQFMEIPPEVLTTSMRVNQKYFSLVDSAAKLAPRFLVVANMETNDGGKAIVAGNERVLRARLSDAKFFWDQDRKVKLEERVPVLKDIIFHARLGTVADKVSRIQTLAAELAAYIPGADVDQVRSAALLAKADLTTGMVGEFPELQGVMGRYYAMHEGEKPAVADAIAEHYAPLGPADRCPTAPVSVAVALADKIDSLVGFFAIDEKPTGSKDPFALRRAALGAIRLIVENRLRVSLRKVFKESYRLHLYFGDGDALERLFYFFEREGLKIEEYEKLARSGFFQHVLNYDGMLDDLVHYVRRAGIAKFEDTQLDRFVRTLTQRIELASRLTYDPVYEQLDAKDREDIRREYQENILKIDACATILIDELLRFFADRLKVALREKGVRHDLISAVFALGGEDDLVRLLARVDALKTFLDSVDGANLLVAYRRASNIVRIEETKDGRTYNSGVDAGLLRQGEEKALHQALATSGDAGGRALESEDFAGAMTALARLRQPVDAFFDKVTVNCEEVALRANRLRLLSEIRATLNRVADFSQIEG